MTSESQQPKGQENPLSKLSMAVNALNLAKDASGIAPAQAAFRAASALLTTIRVFVSCSPAMGFVLTFLQDSMSNEEEYVEIGLSCADICRALDRGMGGRRLDDFSQSVCEAINQLTT